MKELCSVAITLFPPFLWRAVSSYLTTFPGLRVASKVYLSDRVQVFEAAVLGVHRASQRLLPQFRRRAQKCRNKA